MISMYNNIVVLSYDNVKRVWIIGIMTSVYHYMKVSRYLNIMIPPHVYLVWAKVFFSIAIIFSL